MGHISHSNVSLFSVTLLSAFILLSFTIVFSDQKVFGGTCPTTVSFDKDLYAVSDTATISATRTGCGTNDEVIDTIPVDVESDFTRTPNCCTMAITLTETGPATHIFVENIDFVIGECDCSGLPVNYGDQIYVTVTSGDSATDTAMIESLGPAPTVTEIGTLDHISKGLAFVPGDGDTLYSISRDGSILRTIDPTNGLTLDEITMSFDDCGECLASVEGGNGLAWDSENGKLWAIVRVIANDDDVRALAIIDPSIDGSEFPNISFVGILPYNFAGLAVDPTMGLLGVTGKTGSNAEELFLLTSLDTMPETFSDPEDAPDIYPDSVVALEGGENGEAIAFNTGDDLLYHASSGLFETVDLSDTSKHAINIIDTPLENNEPTALTYWESEDALYETQWFCDEGCTTILYRIDLEETSPIPTTLSLNTINDPSTGQRFTVTGSLEDNAGSGIAGIPIQFDGNGTVDDLADAITGGFSVTADEEDEFEIASCCDSSDNVLYVNDGTTFEFDNNPDYVMLYLRDMGTNTVSVSVTGPDHSFGPTSGTGQGNNIGIFTLFNPGGISSIHIDSIADTDPAGITRVQTLNSDLVPIIDENFDDIEADFYSSSSFAEGTFSSVGTSRTTPATNLEVRAFFTGDTSYEASDDTEFYDVLFSTTAGIGGNEGSVTADTGLGITSVECENDQDEDSLCDDWEMNGPGAGSGIPYSGGFITLPDSNTLVPDVYVEIDYMSTQNPFSPAGDNAITRVQNVFHNHGIELHVQQGNVITTVSRVFVWQGGLATPNDDFDGIKSQHFGTGLGTGQTPAKIAKAQAYRYIIFVSNIGGPSGLAELRGNDGIVALGVGFTGTSGSIEQKAGTLMHELGHLLNLQHGGPQYIISDPDKRTLADASINCKPNQASVMSYSRQFPNYLSATEWKLDYSNGDLGPDEGLQETALTESGGNLVNTTTPAPIIVWKNSAGVQKQAARVGGVGPSDINWDGIGGISGSAVSADINNFGISGCSASLTSSFYKNYNEWANLDFNFRQGPSGQIDGTHEPPQSELNVDINKQITIGSAYHQALFPWKPNSSLELKKGIPVPIDVRLFDGLNKPIVKGDTTVSYKIYKKCGEPPLIPCSPSPISGGTGSLVYDKFVTKSWVGLAKAPKDKGIYYIEIILNGPPQTITKDPDTNPPYMNNGMIASLQLTVK